MLGEVYVFDNVYTDIDVNTKGMIRGMFEQPIEIKLYPGVPKRKDMLTVESFA